MKRIKKADLFLTGGILLAGCLFALFLFFFSEKGDFVQVRVSGKVTAVYPLSDDGVYEIAGKDGTNRLVIENGEAWMEEASCPDKLCVKTGHIKKVGQSVICLPNQVTLEIVSGKSGGKSQTEVDVIAG